MKKRIFMSVVGVVICAVSIGFFKYAALGVDPFQSLMAGLNKLFPISFGTLYMISNALLLLFSLWADRHYVGVATFINIFLLGYIVQFTLEILQKILPDPALPLRVGSLLIGVISICFACSFYITADLGVSTYDAVALIIADTWKKGKFKYVRICTDIVSILTGAALFLLAGGKRGELPAIIGFGTVIAAFFMGPFISFFNVHVSEPFLQGGKMDEPVQTEKDREQPQKQP